MRLRPVRAPGRTLAARKLPRRFTSTGLAHSDPRGGGHAVRAGQLPPAARRAGAVPLRASARAGAAAAAPPAAAFPAWAAVVCPLTPSWHGTPSPPPPPPHAPLRPPQFTTPIYHPNIDSAGRICLDILNMPPKGAWKPSLNLPTVLSSIQLLMSHPNPDDGLMVEIVRPPSHAVSRTLCGHCASATARPQLAAARLAHLLTPPTLTDARVHPPPREVQADGRGAHPPPCAPRLRRLRRLRPRLLRRRQLLHRRLSPGGWRPRCRGEQCQGGGGCLGRRRRRRCTAALLLGRWRRGGGHQRRRRRAGRPGGERRRNDRRRRRDSRRDDVDWLCRRRCRGSRLCRLCRLCRLRRLRQAAAAGGRLGGWPRAAGVRRVRTGWEGGRSGWCLSSAPAAAHPTYLYLCPCPPPAPAGAAACSRRTRREPSGNSHMRSAGLYVHCVPEGGGGVVRRRRLVPSFYVRTVGDLPFRQKK